MRTTLNLPDDLMRAVKMRAVQENRRLQDTVAELLRRGLACEPGSSSIRRPRRVELPLVECVREAQPGREITPERAAEILTSEEAGERRGPL